MRRAWCKRKAFNSAPHPHPHPAHTHIQTHTHPHKHSNTLSPTPPSCADLLESAVVVGGPPPSEEVHHLPPFSPPPSLLPSLAVSLARCRRAAGGNGDDMTSLKRVLEKVITAHPLSSLSHNPFPFFFSANPPLDPFDTQHPPSWGGRAGGSYSVPTHPSTSGWYVSMSLYLVCVRVAVQCMCVFLFALCSSEMIITPQTHFCSYL